MSQENESKMQLWRMNYTLDSEFYITRWESWVWSTSQPDINTAFHPWNVLHPNFYTIRDFSVEIESDSEKIEDDSKCIPHILFEY